MNFETVATTVRTRPPSARGLLLAGLFATILPAQDDKSPLNVDVTGETIIMSVDENKGVPLTDFIKTAERLTGKVFVFPKGEAENETNNITFVGTVKLKREKEFFAFFQTMLYIKGFACVIRGKGALEMVDIISSRGQRVAEIAIGAQYVAADDLNEYQHQTGVQVLTSIPLEHLDAAKASQQLRPFFTSGGGRNGLQFGNAGNQKSLLLQGYGPQVFQAYRLLQLVDVPEEVIDLVIEPVGLVYAAAEELEPLLNDLLGDRNRPRPAAGAAAILQQTQIKILAQVTTNLLIVSGTRDQVTEAKDLIAQLDRPLEDNIGEAHVYRLQNVLAKELRETLKQFLDQEKAAEDQAKAGQQASAARRPRRPVVVAHEESNMLLISAPASKYKQLIRMIGELDKRQRQVLVECAVVELSTSDIKRFGIELGLLDIKDNGDFTRPFGFTNFGQSNFSDTDDDGLPDTRLPDFDNPLLGFTGGIISGGDFAIPVLLNALQDNNEANVLSLPSVIVNDNENALVESKENRPTVQSNQGTATTQQSFGGFQDAGINLTISPSISSNNYLRLNVELEVSRFITAFDPNSATPGVKATRKIKTQVTLPSGHTMVIGGVIEDQESTTKSGIPFLMDIPLLGWLFKTHAADKRKTNLYFFLTPYILDEDDFSDLDEMSTRKKLEAQHYIGSRRMEILDPKWNAAKAKAEVLDDPGSTIDDLDRGFSFEFPNYKRPDRLVRSGKIDPIKFGKSGDSRPPSPSSLVPKRKEK